MVRRSIQMFTFVLLLAACDKDDVRPTPKTYFQLDVADTYETEFSDNWVFINDEKGALWDVKSFERNQSLVFDSTVVPEGKITVTLMRYGKGAFEYDLDTYLGESVGENWILKDRNVLIETGSYVGNLSVQVSDPQLGSLLNAEISSRFITPGLATTVSASSYIFPDIGVYSNANDVFVFITDKNGKPYYKFMEDATGGSFNYSLDDFSEFEKEVNINFPPSDFSLMLVKAFDDTQPFQGDHGYYINYYLEGLNTAQTFSTYRTGYLNRFSRYLTFMHARYEDYDLSYEAYGAIPSTSSIDVDDFDQTITDKTFANFSVSSTDFQHRTTTWSASYEVNGARMGTVWNMISDNEHLKNVVNIPKIIVDLYPNINKGEFRHYQTVFNKGTRTFADVVGEKFKGATVKPYVQTRKAI
jgi:hypothetical protein